MIRLLSTLILAAAGSTAVGTLVADPAPQTKPGPSDSRQATRGGGSEADTVLATWLLVDNKLEIEVSKLAAQKATNPEVKQFAQQMVQDHQSMGQKIQPFAARTDLVGSADEDGMGGMDDTDDMGDTREASAPRLASDFDHIGLIEELGQQCLQSATKELQSKQGAEFDHCYIGMAIGAHQKMSDMMSVFERHASGELKSTIQEGHRSVKQHLEQAKEIAESMKDEMTKDR